MFSYSNFWEMSLKILFNSGKVLQLKLFQESLKLRIAEHPRKWTRLEILWSSISMQLQVCNKDPITRSEGHPNLFFKSRHKIVCNSCYSFDDKIASYSGDF